MGQEIKPGIAKKDIRLICADLDGTIVDPVQSSINYDAASTIKRYLANPQNHLAIISARMPQGIQSELNNVGLRNQERLYTAGYHGNLCSDGTTNLADSPFDRGIASYLQDQIQARNLRGIVFHKNAALATMDTPHEWPQWYATKARHPVGTSRGQSDIYMVELLKDPNCSTDQFLHINKLGNIAANIFTFSPAIWEPPFTCDIVQFIPKGSDKGSAVANYAAKLGIPLTQVLAIGDGDADARMFLPGVTSVAMGNGTKLVKEKAAYVTTPVPNGFPYALEHLVN